MVTQRELEKQFSGIIDLRTSKNLMQLGVVKDIDIHDDNKRVYVVLKHHDEMEYFEGRVRDIIKGYGYEPEIEIE